MSTRSSGGKVTLDILDGLYDHYRELPIEFIGALDLGKIGSFTVNATHNSLSIIGLLTYNLPEMYFSCMNMSLPSHIYAIEFAQNTSITFETHATGPYMYMDTMIQVVKATNLSDGACNDNKAEDMYYWDPASLI
eukprot:121816_1